MRPVAYHLFSLNISDQLSHLISPAPVISGVFTSNERLPLPNPSFTWRVDDDLTPSEKRFQKTLPMAFPWLCPKISVTALLIISMRKSLSITHWIPGDVLNKFERSLSLVCVSFNSRLFLSSTRCVTTSLAKVRSEFSCSVVSLRRTISNTHRAPSLNPLGSISGAPA